MWLKIYYIQKQSTCNVLDDKCYWIFRIEYIKTENWKISSMVKSVNNFPQNIAG